MFKGSFPLLKAIGLTNLYRYNKRYAQKESSSLNSILATITFSSGKTVDYKGSTVGAASWTYINGINLLSILAKDKCFNNAFLSFKIRNVNEAGCYSFGPPGLTINQARLLWDGMDYERWMGYETGDIYGDGTTEGGGTIMIDVLNEKCTKGTFSMIMTNDLSDRIKVEGSFNSLVRRQVE